MPTLTNLNFTFEGIWSGKFNSKETMAAAVCIIFGKTILNMTLHGSSDHTFRH